MVHRSQRSGAGSLRAVGAAMIWWLRTRRWPFLAVAVVLACVPSLQFGALRLPVPPAFGHVPRPPLAVLLPLIVVVAVLSVLPEADELPNERAPVRRLGVRDVALVVSVVGAVIVTTLVGRTVVSWEFSDAFMRDTIGLMGVGLLMRSLLSGRLASVLTSLYAVLCVVAGNGAAGVARFWAWPANLDHDPFALAMAIAAFVLGACPVFSTLR